MSAGLIQLFFLGLPEDFVPAMGKESREREGKIGEKNKVGAVTETNERERSGGAARLAEKAPFDNVWDRNRASAGEYFWRFLCASLRNSVRATLASVCSCVRRQFTLDSSAGGAESFRKVDRPKSATQHAMNWTVVRALRTAHIGKFGHRFSGPWRMIQFWGKEVLGLPEDILAFRVEIWGLFGPPWSNRITRRKGKVGGKFWVTFWHGICTIAKTRRPETQTNLGGDH